MSSTPYNRQNSFALFSAENPTKQQSGASLDAEFNAVKISLDDTQQNLAKIQDDDGALKRGSVGQAQFDSSVSLGFAAPSQWASGGLYTANVNTVFHDSIFFIANTTHTSGVSFDASNWDEIADFTAAAAIPDDSITSAKLADGAVAANKLADGVVANSKLATGAVSTSKIADAAASAVKLGADVPGFLRDIILPAGLGPLPYSGTTPPTGWDWADGGVLLVSTAFTALRQLYIDASFPYGQDGSGNPKKPDAKGSLIVGKDNMNGSAAGRVTSAGSGIDGATLGARGGTESSTLARANLPNVAPTFTGTQGAALSNSSQVNIGGGAIGGMQSGAGTFVMLNGVTQAQISSTYTPSGTVQSLNGGVPQTSFTNMPPSLVCNMIIKAH
ncbi:hypothetical protein [Bradyrhizobium canariense]|uniref:Microcystin-dependent protein n=1 Tax=Bradyrhizobium canariense TaxID=255045 RepID=A0A1X3FXA5_9BRAD|nr:hypothetical protein [Bradyrhizobium canariense]OSI19553.1 hypothetical protein BST65_38620 [Bradyrhizobium canariense]OSI32358.1 hypothetical protein BST66_17180 [Bradyrhizobium canariense]OSI42813.1 hypothetical protein BST67_39635 [Bradyrhizobium canariense]OSI51091.1 hypothetical protein BSZ20_04995 [Bradyrhizobium canariense]OSI59814.1 hypothetical protein BSZ15_02805 [Bradyrhizobium canariense]